MLVTDVFEPQLTMYRAWTAASGSMAARVPSVRSQPAAPAVAQMVRSRSDAPSRWKNRRSRLLPCSLPMVKACAFIYGSKRAASRPVEPFRRRAEDPAGVGELAFPEQDQEGRPGRVAVPLQQGTQLGRAGLRPDGGKQFRPGAASNAAVLGVDLENRVRVARPRQGQ